MIAMATPLKQAEFAIDFDLELPPWDFFPVWWLAKSWHCTPQHVLNLIDSGELEVGVDLRNAASSRSAIRAPRKAVVKFLNVRRDLHAIADANPRPAYREESKRTKK